MAPRQNDVKQGPNIRFLQAYMEVCEDPDAPDLDAYAEGVKIGYKMQMPRTPAAYNRKKRWRLEYESNDKDAEEWASN